MLQTSDSKLVDRALAALVEEMEERQELHALEAQPYKMTRTWLGSLSRVRICPYDGDVPAEVARLAARRRSRR